MKKDLVIAGALAAMFFTAGVTFAQTTATFPIPELGSCDSKDACKAYCDVVSHSDACLTYAQAHGLMKPAQVSAARAILAKKGPGGCTDKSSCTAYCSDTVHSATCLQFAQTQGLVATSTALLAKQIVASGGPGGCKTGDECHTYCQDTAHISECKQFAQDNGLKQQEADSKINDVLQSKLGPGGCTDKNSCKSYCDNTAHGDECRQFALDNGLMSKQQFEQAQVVASSTGPGGCKGAACKVYCEDLTHRDACLNFAVKVGVVPQGVASTSQNIQNILTTEGGPGGCKTPQECSAYCRDTTHQVECSAFLDAHRISKPPLPPSIESTTAPRSPVPQTPFPPHPQNTMSTTSQNGDMPPKPPIVPGTMPNTGTQKVVCHSIDECKAVCGTNTANCLFIPPTTEIPPSGTNPPTNQMPLPPTGTTAPNTTTTQKVICHSMDECKAVCGTNTANCMFVPPKTDTPPPTTSPTSNTSNMGSAVLWAFLNFFVLH